MIKGLQAYTYILVSCHIVSLFNNFSDDARTNSAATLTNSKAQTIFHRDRRYQVYNQIHIETLPVSGALKSAFDEKSQHRFALTAGDDYELCFTSSLSVPAELGGVPVTAIGTITEGSSLVCRNNGEIVELADGGYRHFQ